MTLFGEAGVSYATAQDPITDVTARHREQADSPRGVDVACTQGVPTPSRGSNPQIYDVMARTGRFGADVSVPHLDGRLLFGQDTPGRSRRTLAGQPTAERPVREGIIAFSEQTERRLADTLRFAVGLPAHTAAPGVGAPSLGRALGEGEEHESGAVGQGQKLDDACRRRVVPKSVSNERGPRATTTAPVAHPARPR